MVICGPLCVFQHLMSVWQTLFARNYNTTMPVYLEPLISECGLVCFVNAILIIIIYISMELMNAFVYICVLVCIPSLVSNLTA